MNTSSDTTTTESTSRISKLIHNFSFKRKISLKESAHFKLILEEAEYKNLKPKDEKARIA